MYLVAAAAHDAAGAAAPVLAVAAEAPAVARRAERQGGFRRPPSRSVPPGLRSRKQPTRFPDPPPRRPREGGSGE